MEYWGFLLFFFFFPPQYPPPVSFHTDLPRCHWGFIEPRLNHPLTISQPLVVLSDSASAQLASLLIYHIWHRPVPGPIFARLCVALAFVEKWEDKPEVIALVWVCVNPVCRPSCRCYNVMDRGCFVSVSAFWYLYALAKQKGTQSCESTD